MTNAIILLSGGMDSAVALALAREQGFACYALTFDYGQKNRYELTAAKNVAQHMHVVQQHIVSLPLDCFKNSALTAKDIDVPDYVGAVSQPVTYVPARNTIFLAIALGWAELVDAQAIYVGCSAVDFSGYADCRPEYFAAFQQLADLAIKNGNAAERVTIVAPLLHKSKAETVQLGVQHGVDFSLTVSCYNHTPEGIACRTCDGCTYRQQGFADAGVSDLSYLKR